MSTKPRAISGALFSFLALFAALSLCLSPAPPAAADDRPDTGKNAGSGEEASPGENADPGKKASPGEKIARGLRESPVYVDPAYEDAFTPSQRTRLAERIKRSGIPIRIVVVPYFSGDAWGGEPREMADVVRDRLGESPAREAVYLTLSDSGDAFLNGYEYPDDKHRAFWGAAAVGHLDEMKDRDLYTKFSRAIDIVKAGNGDKVYKRATKDLDATRTEPPREPEGPSVPALIALAVGGLVVALLAAWLVVRYLRHRSRGSVRVPFTSP